MNFIIFVESEKDKRFKLNFEKSFLTQNNIMCILQ